MVKEVKTKSEYESVAKSELSALQSWEWGEFKGSTSDWSPKRMIINNQTPVSILIRKLPVFNYLIGYIPRAKLTCEEIEALCHYSRSIGLAQLIVDPEWEKDSVEVFGKPLKRKSIQPNFTNIISLQNKSVEDLWMGMNGKYRRNIKKAHKHALEVKIVDSYHIDSLRKFLAVLQQVSNNTDFIMLEENYFKEMFRIFSESSKAKIYIAETKESKVVGAYLVVFGSNIAYELYGGVTSEGRDCEAGYALKWESIKDALSSGYDYYDHWGVAPFDLVDDRIEYDKVHPLYNISKFKNGFGGDNIRYEDQLIYNFNLFAEVYYRTLLLIRKFVLVFKKRIKRAV